MLQVQAMLNNSLGEHFGHIGVCTDLVERVDKGEQVAAGGAGRVTAQRAADVAQRACRIGREQHLCIEVVPGDIKLSEMITQIP